VDDDFNYQHLQTLGAIARLGSFSQAAEALRLSQPAVSHHIRHLERLCGVPLLERVGRRAAPTEAGALLLAHAARAFGELEAAREALHRLKGVVAGRVRVGTGATASIYHLPPVFRRLRLRYPRLDLEVVTGNSAGIAAAVVRNDLDLGIVTLPVAAHALSVSLFYVDRLIAVAPPGRAWRRRGGCTPAELARHPLILYERGGTIRAVIDQWFRRGRAAPNVAMELGNAEAIKKLVEAGFGLSITSEVSVRAEVKARALNALPLVPALHRRLGIVQRRDKAASPARAAVVAALQAFARMHAARTIG
jgi:DNA-binding transcriptional LysR family regulator